MSEISALIFDNFLAFTVNPRIMLLELKLMIHRFSSQFKEEPNG